MQPWVWVYCFATCEAYFGFLLSGLISPTDYPVVLMAGSGSVKLSNKDPDCSVNVLLPVGVTAPEWSRVASAGRNPHIRAITDWPGFRLASQLARQSASQLPRPLMEEMDFTKAVCVTWHPLSGTWWSTHTLNKSCLNAIINMSSTVKCSLIFYMFTF